MIDNLNMHGTKTPHNQTKKEKSSQLSHCSYPIKLGFTKRCMASTISTMKNTKKVVLIGGGTGSYTVASGLRSANIDLTMVMTMVDDGGSNKIIRDEFGLLPTSGIRQAIVALSDNKTILRKLFTYRFHKGGGNLEGMTFGNLFMAAMADIMQSQKKGIEETCKLLQVHGTILPSSFDDVRLVATYDDGSEVVGEHSIDEPGHTLGHKIISLKTKPKARLNSDVKDAILAADLVILGPGDFYTNTVANLVVEGMSDVIKQTQAKVMFITNLMTSPSETPGYALSDFFKDLQHYLPLNVLDFVLVNNNHHFNPKAIAIYNKENSHPTIDDLQAFRQVEPLFTAKVIRTDVLSEQVAQKVKGDAVSRSMIRHHSEKLATHIQKILRKKS